MNLKDIKAVLFDFDGVLADTMEDNFRAWQKAFLKYEVQIKREDYFPLEGTILPEVVKTIGKKYQVKEEFHKEIIKLKNKFYLEDHILSFYPEVPSLIDHLKERDMLLAIVSASPREKLEKTVDATFLAKFNTIVSGDDCRIGKPNPEPYIIAMRRLNVNPNNAIVIENAPLGIQSAKSSRAYCIALTTTLNERYLKEADKVLNNHKELINFFFK